MRCRAGEGMTWMTCSKARPLVAGSWLLVPNFLSQKPEASSQLLVYYFPQIDKFAAVKTKGFKKRKQVG